MKKLFVSGLAAISLSLLIPGIGLAQYKGQRPENRQNNPNTRGEKKGLLNRQTIALNI